MSVNFIQAVPFIKGYRAVISDLESDDGEGVVVIERHDALSDEWLVERIFPCQSRLEAVGISLTFAAGVTSHLDTVSFIARMTNTRVNLPGDRFISMIELSDGSFMAVVEERDASGEISVASSRTEVRNFFEAYGWALSEATLMARGDESRSN